VKNKKVPDILTENSDSWSMGIIFAVTFGIIFDGFIWYVIGFCIGWGSGVPVKKKRENGKKEKENNQCSKD